MTLTKVHIRTIPALPKPEIKSGDTTSRNTIRAMEEYYEMLYGRPSDDPRVPSFL